MRTDRVIVVGRSPVGGPGGDGGDGGGGVGFSCMKYYQKFNLKIDINPH